MKPNIKTIFITGLFLLLFSANLHAQEKYEYAVIKYTPQIRAMLISISGTEYKNLTIEKKDVKGSGDVNVALKEIDKMTNEGWELFTINNTTLPPDYTSYIFYLRKKVK